MVVLIGQGRGETRYGIAMLAFAKVSDEKNDLDGFRWLQTNLEANVE